MLVSRLVELAEQPAGVAFRTKHFPKFWQPVDLWTVVDTNRRITDGTPGQYKDGQPVAKGPMRHDGIVDDAVALELLAALRSSFTRMVPRLVALADDMSSGPVDVGQLVTSAPVDQLWAHVLAGPALVRYMVSAARTAPRKARADRRCCGHAKALHAVHD